MSNPTALDRSIALAARLRTIAGVADTPNAKTLREAADMLDLTRPYDIEIEAFTSNVRLSTEELRAHLLKYPGWNTTYAGTVLDFLQWIDLTVKPVETTAKPDADHCDFPDCEQHYRYIAMQLDKYAFHMHECARLRDADPDSPTYGKCTCGLDALVKAVKDSPEKSEAPRYTWTCKCGQVNDLAFGDICNGCMRRAPKINEQPSAPAVVRPTLSEPPSLGSAAGVDLTVSKPAQHIPGALRCEKHGVTFAFDGDTCWACQEESNAPVNS